VILPAPTPIEAIPAPEMFKRLLKVPAELFVVFPRAVREILEVWILAEIVIVLAACPIPIPAPAEIDTLLDVPSRLKFVAVGTVGPTIVIVLRLLFSVIFAPATSDTLPVLAFKLNVFPPAAAPLIEILCPF
jgi:hypothetical protein